MTVQSKEISLSPWGSAIAGATGAVLANALVYPLDIIKTRLQVQVKSAPPNTTENGEYYTSSYDAMVKIVRDEGMSGLYAGIAGSLIGVASTSFAYFYWYTVVRAFYNSSKLRFRSAKIAVELLLGAIAGAIAQLFTIPVAVVTTRQQTQPKCECKSLIDTGREIVINEDGWTGLWRGLKTSMMLVINPAIMYGAYYRLREVLFPGKKNLKPLEAFLLGSACKTFATIVTQPLIVAKVSLQSKPLPSRSGKSFSTFGEVVKYIVEHEGPVGLFKGIGPQVLKGILVQGFLMMTKERMELLFILFLRYMWAIRTRQLASKAMQSATKFSLILRNLLLF